MYEAVVNTVPQARFGVAFNEASDPCLVRVEGNDDELRAAWGPLALGGVEIRHVAGRHDTMFNPPNVFAAARAK